MALSLIQLLFGALLALRMPSAAQPPATSAAPTVEVTVGLLLPEDSRRSPSARPRVVPALSLALEALQPQLRHAGINVSTAFASMEQDGRCDEKVAEFKAAQLKASHDPDMLLGLSCFDSSIGESYFAERWKLPVLRAGVYQRDRYSMTVYAGPSGPDFIAFQEQLPRHFNCTSPGVLVVSAESHYLEFFYPFSSRLHEYEESGEAARFIQAKGPVVFIYGSPKMLQQIMHEAQAQNMTNGDYVFFYMDIFGESLRAVGHREAAKPWQDKESNDTGGLREAFQMVLVITAHEPQTHKYQRFQREVILRAQRDFGVAINDSLGHLVAGCFHDGLLLYLMALNETLHEGGTKQNTSRILEKMRGLKFQGVTGTVSINSKNIREMDFDLWAMRDVEGGEYQVVGRYIGSEKLINWLGAIHWKEGRPPCDKDNAPSGKSGCVQNASRGTGSRPPVDAGR